MLARLPWRQRSRWGRTNAGSTKPTDCAVQDWVVRGKPYSKEEGACAADYQPCHWFHAIRNGLRGWRAHSLTRHYGCGSELTKRRFVDAGHACVDGENTKRVRHTHRLPLRPIDVGDVASDLREREFGPTITCVEIKQQR